MSRGKSADVKLWSAEEPYLYELLMEVHRCGRDALQEVDSRQRVGFRRFEMKDGHDDSERKADCV